MKSQYVLPITIVVAGVLIAGAVFLVGRSGTAPGGTDDTNRGKVPAVTADEHILGNPNAAVKVIEYSDTECPYCKTFHSTMHAIIDYYGPNGNVAWVFRHMPLAQNHTKAPTEAAATECAAELGGNAGFWKFIDRLYEITPSNNGLDLAQLPVIAKDTGLDVTQFNSCMAGNKYAQKVQGSFNEAVAAGAQGTPFVVIMNAQGGTLVLDGAQPYDSMRAAIDQTLQASGIGVATSTAQ